MGSKRESSQSGPDNDHQMVSKVSGYYLVPPDENDAAPAKSSVDRSPHQHLWADPGLAGAED